MQSQNSLIIAPSLMLTHAELIVINYDGQMPHGLHSVTIVSTLLFL